MPRTPYNQQGNTTEPHEYPFWKKRTHDPTKNCIIWMFRSISQDPNDSFNIRYLCMLFCLVCFSVVSVINLITKTFFGSFPFCSFHLQAAYYVCENFNNIFSTITETSRILFTKDSWINISWNTFHFRWGLLKSIWQKAPEKEVQSLYPKLWNTLQEYITPKWDIRSWKTINSIKRTSYRPCNISLCW